jgi:hypothetical protein
MSVSTILLPVFAHVAFVFVLMFRHCRSATPGNESAGIWRDELALAVLFYVLTIGAWQTRLADILFLVLASIFVALRIIGAGIGGIHRGWYTPGGVSNGLRKVLKRYRLRTLYESCS